MLWLTPLAELRGSVWEFYTIVALKKCWDMWILQALTLVLSTGEVLILLSDKQRHLFRYLKKKKQTKMDQNTSPKLCTSSVCSVWSGCHISWPCTFPHPARQIMLSPPSCGSGGLISDSCQGLSLQLEAFTDGKYQQCSGMLAFNVCEVHFNLWNG